MVDLQNKLPALTLLADTDLSMTTTWGLHDPGADEGNPGTFVVTRDGKITFRQLEQQGKGDWPTYDELAAALK